MIDVARWSLNDAVGVCARLRREASEAPSLENAAGRIVRALRLLIARSEHQSDVVLARLFLTQRRADLPDGVRAPADCPPDGLVLALLGTDGDLPAWCDPRRSAAHQAISLADGAAVANAPMVAALVSDLGLDLDRLRGGHGGAQDGEFEIFHVEQAGGSARVPAQDFVREHGVGSVVGFGGSLATGEVFTVVLFLRCNLSARAAELFKPVAVTCQLILASLLHTPVFAGGPERTAHERLVAPSRTSALERLLEVEEVALGQQHEALRREAEIIDTLHTVGESLTKELDLELVVGRATEACVEVTRAQFGAFFYNVADANGERYMLYTVAGVPREHFTQFPMPRNTPVFAPTFAGDRVVRSADITREPVYGTMDPHRGMPPGHLPVRSYLAVPVVSTTGEVHGGLFFGHEDVGVFDARAERLAGGIASQTAVAIDNAMVFRRQRETAIDLQRALLPRALADVPGADVCHRYVPGAAGVEVGGDWYDVIRRPDGSYLLVIGDVMGRGPKAAAAMGQLRAATRALNIAGLQPAEMLQHLNALAGEDEDNRMATCLLGVYRTTGEFTLANAGHLPPLVSDGREVSILEVPTDPPLGVLRDCIFSEQTHHLPAGSTLLLFTDGLVEDRARSVDDGMRELSELLLDRDFSDDLCDKIVESMVGGREDADDIALLALTRAPRMPS